MDRKAPKLLEDILDAASFVRDAVSGETQEQYEANRILRQAVERNFEIIGEAMNRLSKLMTRRPRGLVRLRKSRRFAIS